MFEESIKESKCVNEMLNHKPQKSKFLVPTKKSALGIILNISYIRKSNLC